jgi:hypothetical protein
MVMDLGFRSDPNMHRAHSDPSRVRIQARQEVAGVGKTSEKLVSSGSAYLFTIEKRQSKYCNGAKKHILRKAATSALTFMTFSYKGRVNEFHLSGLSATLPCGTSAGAGKQTDAMRVTRQVEGSNRAITQHVLLGILSKAHFRQSSR